MAENNREIEIQIEQEITIVIYRWIQMLVQNGSNFNDAFCFVKNEFVDQTRSLVRREAPFFNAFDHVRQDPPGNYSIRHRRI